MKINLAVYTATEGFDWQPGTVYSRTELNKYKEMIGRFPDILMEKVPYGGIFVCEGKLVFYRLHIAHRGDSRGRDALYCVLGTIPLAAGKKVNISRVFEAPEFREPMRPFPTAIEIEESLPARVPTTWNELSEGLSSPPSLAHIGVYATCFSGGKFFCRLEGNASNPVPRLTWERSDLEPVAPVVPSSAEPSTPVESSLPPQAKPTPPPSSPRADKSGEWQPSLRESAQPTYTPPPRVLESATGILKTITAILGIVFIFGLAFLISRGCDTEPTLEVAQEKEQRGESLADHEFENKGNSQKSNAPDDETLTSSASQKKQRSHEDTVDSLDLKKSEDQTQSEPAEKVAETMEKSEGVSDEEGSGDNKPKWIPGTPYSGNKDIIAGEKEGTWVSAKPGYEVKPQEGGILFLEWKKGETHPKNDRLVSTEYADTWESKEPGWKWDGKSGIEWNPRTPYPGKENIIAGETEDSWVSTKSGYVISGEGEDMKLVWTKDEPYPGKKNIVAGETEGTWVSTKSGYVISGEGEGMELEWRQGRRHNKDTNIVAGEGKDTWVSAKPGYVISGEGEEMKLNWKKDEPYPGKSGIVAGETEGMWVSTKPGYVISGKGKDMKLNWKKDEPYPGKSGIVAGEKEGTWISSKPGYVVKEQEGGILFLEWEVGMALDQYGYYHWVTIKKENRAKPAPGYQKKDKNVSGWSTLIWTPGLIDESTDVKRKAAQTEGSWLHQVDCGSCDGKGEKSVWVKCSNCKGDGCVNGLVQCDACDGRGQMTDGEKCQTCGGNRAVISGKKPCSACDENGKVKCEVKCSDCGKDGCPPGKVWR